MKAVVPAAGRGTRLRPLTDEQPKGLVDISDRPLLSYCFDRLVDLSVTEIVVVVGYRGDQIRETFGCQYEGVQLSYVRQDERRGLAHAILQAAPRVDEPFVVLNGDNVFGSSLAPVVAAHRQAAADGTVVVEGATREQATETGVVVTDGDGRVTEIVEKPADPPSSVVTTGCYVLPPATFDACRAIAPSDRGEYELPAVVTRLVETGHDVVTTRLEGWRVNVNTPADRERAADRLSGAD